MALFGRQTQQRGSSRFLVEFKAGRMTMEGKTVKADPRKGLVYMHKGEEDNLIHFCWKERTATSAEEDLIIFPNDVEFKKVPQCTTGRVFVLRVRETGRKIFYWVQEPDAAKDEENFKKITDYLAGKTPPRSAAPAAGAEGGIPADLQSLGIDDADLQQMLQGVDRNQLLQLLGMQGGGAGAGNLLQSLRGAARAEGGAPATPAVSAQATRPTGGAAGAPPKQPPRKAAAAARPNFQLSELRNILSSVAPNAAGIPPSAEEPVSVDWTPALSQSLLLPILSNPAFVERLIPHLPQDPLVPHTAQEVMSTIQSPQFQQAVQAFTAAFETRQLGPLIREFDLGPQAVQAADNGDFKAFVKALEKKKEEETAAAAGSGKPEAEGQAKPPGKDDDEMSVD